jgi:hypothetical protein
VGTMDGLMVGIILSYKLMMTASNT